MGFYYGSTRPPFQSGDAGSVITPREYILLLSGATRVAASCTPQESDGCRSRTGGAIATSTLIERLSRRLQHRPGEASTYRMLGIAELHAGNSEAAIRHLATAVQILLTRTPIDSLPQLLYARVELALLIPTLIRLCRRLQRHAMVRCLVRALADLPLLR